MYTRRRLNQRQRELQKSLAPQVAAMAWKAQERLHRRYCVLSHKGKPSGKIITALARELAGFVWAVGVETEKGTRAGEGGVSQCAKSKN